jgi:hypothetical protein
MTPRELIDSLNMVFILGSLQIKNLSHRHFEQSHSTLTTTACNGGVRNLDEINQITLLNLTLI